MTIVRLKVGTANMRNSMSGWRMRNDRRTTNASTAADNATETMVRGEVHPQSAVCRDTTTSPMIPDEMSAQPRRSRGRTSRKPTSRRSRIAMVVAMRPMGTLIRKIHRQLAAETSQPPTGGPRAGAAIIEMPHTPRAVPRRWGGNSS